MKQLVVRADTGLDVGMGHMMRCLALAHGWKSRGGQATFITTHPDKTLLQRLYEDGFNVVILEQSYPDPSDWEITSQVLAANSGAWTAVDGYHFDPTYHMHIRDAGHNLLVIDDTAHLHHYQASILLNANIAASKLVYNCDRNTRLLLGIRYVLLRPEFLEWRTWSREITKVARKVLITLGGSDRDNATHKVIAALQDVRIPGLEAKVVVGAANPNLDVLRRAARNSHVKLQLHTDVTNMPDLMAWADVAITAGGSTCWEVAFMGLPSLVLVLAANQLSSAEELDEIGAAHNLGCFDGVRVEDISEALSKIIDDYESRLLMNQISKAIVDGDGCERVVDILENLQSQNGSNSLSLRQASISDAVLLWQWANDPITRANSFNIEPIPFDKHLAWYTEALKASNVRIWMLELGQIPVAQIRYESCGQDLAEISYSVSDGHRGQGLGTRLLHMSQGKVYKELGARRLRGVTFADNVASAQAFAKAGFTLVSEERIDRHHCYVFERDEV